jgi:hypothetical protein
MNERRFILAFSERVEAAKVTALGDPGGRGFPLARRPVNPAGDSAENASLRNA